MELEFTAPLGVNLPYLKGKGARGLIKVQCPSASNSRNLYNHQQRTAYRITEALCVCVWARYVCVISDMYTYIYIYILCYAGKSCLLCCALWCVLFVCACVCVCGLDSARAGSLSEKLVFPKSTTDSCSHNTQCLMTIAPAPRVLVRLVLFCRDA